jgi:hypothetical protein
VNKVSQRNPPENTQQAFFWNRENYRTPEQVQAASALVPRRNPIMSRSAQEILEEAPQLPPGEFDWLIGEVLQAGDGSSDAEIEASWKTEAERRVADGNAGAAATYSWEEIEAPLRARLARWQRSSSASGPRLRRRSLRSGAQGLALETWEPISRYNLPMSPSAQRILEEARQLPPDEVDWLVESLLIKDRSQAEAQIEAAWDSEIERRLHEIDSGTVEMIPLEDVIAEMDATIRARQRG